MLPAPQSDPSREADEQTIHSFIVRVWVEEMDESSQHPLYRGQVVCLPKGERYYFKQLDEILTIIQSTIETDETAP